MAGLLDYFSGGTPSGGLLDALPQWLTGQQQPDAGQWQQPNQGGAPDWFSQIKQQLANGQGLVTMPGRFPQMRNPPGVPNTAMPGPQDGGGGALPPNAQPAMQPPQQAPQQQPGTPQQQPPIPPQFQNGPPMIQGGMGDRVLGALGGFTNARGFLPAITNAITTMATGRVTDPVEYGRQTQQQNQTAVYQALRQAGIEHGPAMAAALSPEAAKAILPEAFQAPKVVQTGEDMYGGKTFKLQKGGGKFEDIPGSGGGSGDAAAPGGIDESLRGHDYLAQYPKNVQAAVKDYMDGLAQPVGNPRKGFAQVVRTIAQRVGNDIGMPVDEASFAARRKMRVDLNASGNSTMGGIITNGQSAIEHLANLSDKYAALGNRNGPDIPGGAWIGQGANKLGNQILPNSKTKDIVSQANNNALRYGQESTKFYAGSGGGHEERLMALKNNNPEGSTSDQLAGFLQTEKELILGRLHQKELQIKEALGQRYLDDHPVRNKSVEEQLAKIDANITKLRGTAKPAATNTAGDWTVKQVR